VPYTKAMSARLPARTAVLCYLPLSFLLGVTIARAERRPVAVIDLSDEPPGEKLAGEIGGALNDHVELKPIDDPNMWKVLIGRITDEDKDRIDGARKNKVLAEASLEQRNFSEAASVAEDGQNKLRMSVPTPQVLSLYAELAFLVGYARLGERNPTKATLAFRLAHDLDPGFKPDTLRVLPEVVQAFEAAQQQKPQLATISIKGSGTRVFIDSKEYARDSHPDWYEVIAGTHVVWLVGPDRDARATQVTVDPQRKENAAIDEARTSEATKVRRARIALKSAPDPTARAAAIRQLATLLDVRDAVLLTMSNGKMIVQTWRDREPGFSALREYRIDKGDKAADLLIPLATPPKPLPRPKPKKEIPITIVTEKSWLSKHKLWVGGGTVAAVALGVVIYGLTTWDRSFQNDTNITGVQRR
jgi:hypothetical protein